MLEGWMYHDSLRDALREIRENVRAAVNAPADISALSELTDNIGLITAGEVRSGNGAEPGSKFSGLRYGWPGFYYGGYWWNLVGVYEDVMQFAASTTDGKLYFGGGAGVLEADGIALVAGSVRVPSKEYKLVDAIGGNIVGTLYATSGGPTALWNLFMLANPDAAYNTATAKIGAIGKAGYGGSVYHYYDSYLEKVTLTAKVSLFDGLIREGGTSFPASPSNADQYFKNSTYYDCYWDNANSVWVTKHRQIVTMEQITTANSLNSYVRIPNDKDILLGSMNVTTRVITTNDSSNYWTLTWTMYNSVVASGVAIYTFDTRSDTAGSWTQHDGTPSTIKPSSKGMLRLNMAKTGSPGALDVTFALPYQQIIT